ncbi:hypothetical protein ACC706_38925, partial [Rhizobium johnstonii]
NDFSYRNSPENIRRFPFPFDRDEYIYSVNMEPHVHGRAGTVYESLIDDAEIALGLEGDIFEGLIGQRRGIAKGEAV